MLKPNTHKYILLVLTFVNNYIIQQVMYVLMLSVKYKASLYWIFLFYFCIIETKIHAQKTY
ncbi:hypothetical protein EDC94DRAFT_275880 [Helicostylum pulchrum]|nr:hypothetical protein EDC94DRAFT_275880 [Helicostylum pulchrum]